MTISFFISAILIFLWLSSTFEVNGLEMDVKCTVYEGSDDKNGDNVDVRTFVMGLKENSSYTAEVIPDHNPSTTVTAKTDPEGIFWAVAKIINGEKSLLFKVNIYLGNGTVGQPVVFGDDDVPCYPITSIKK